MDSVKVKERPVKEKDTEATIKEQTSEQASVTVTLMQTQKSGDSESVTIDFKGNEEQALKFWKSEVTEQTINKFTSDVSYSLHVTFIGVTESFKASSTMENIVLSVIPRSSYYELKRRTEKTNSIKKKPNSEYGDAEDCDKTEKVWGDIAICDVTVNLPYSPKFLSILFQQKEKSSQVHFVKTLEAEQAVLTPQESIFERNFNALKHRAVKETKQSAIRMIHLVTNIIVTLSTGESKVVKEGDGTSYHGPAEKASEFLLSLAYRTSISHAIRNAKVGPHTAIKLEIKHQQNQKNNGNHVISDLQRNHNMNNF